MKCIVETIEWNNLVFIDRSKPDHSNTRGIDRRTVLSFSLVSFTFSRWKFKIIIDGIYICVYIYIIYYYSSTWSIRISFTTTYTKRFVRRCNSLDCCYCCRCYCCCSSRKKTKKRRKSSRTWRFLSSNEAKLVSRLFFRSTSGISRE